MISLFLLLSLYLPWKKVKELSSTRHQGLLVLLIYSYFVSLWRGNGRYQIWSQWIYYFDTFSVEVWHNINNLTLHLKPLVYTGSLHEWSCFAKERTHLALHWTQDILFLSDRTTDRLLCLCVFSKFMLYDMTILDRRTGDNSSLSHSLSPLSVSISLFLSFSLFLPPPPLSQSFSCSNSLQIRLRSILLHTPIFTNNIMQRSLFHFLLSLLSMQTTKCLSWIECHQFLIY